MFRRAKDIEPKAWEDWYRFARDALAQGHEEAVEYANLRSVEEQNRAVMRRGETGSGPSASPPPGPR